MCGFMSPRIVLYLQCFTGPCEGYTMIRILGLIPLFASFSFLELLLSFFAPESSILLGIVYLLLGFLTFSRFGVSIAMQRKSREEIYGSNTARITAHNKDYNSGITSYSMDANQFADLSLEEWASQVRKISLFYSTITL